MIKRRLFDELKNHLDYKEISLIVGPRQAGKTTLMMELVKFLRDRGDKAVFYSLDLEADRDFFSSQAALINKVKLELGKDRGYVFIDEIQRQSDAGIFLKGIFDLNLPYKFVVSGSGSLELKEKIHESLAGRKRVFELQTVSFLEFVGYRTDYRFVDRWRKFFEIETRQIERLLSEYLMFGGYPRAVTSAELIDKTRVMGELYQSYLEKDIRDLLGVEKREEFTNLVQLTASQIGSPTNLSELSSTLGISAATVKNYLWYMEKTFIIYRINPYFRNLRKEITKSPVYYFADLGLRNYAVREFGGELIPAKAGFLFENFVYRLLREKFANTSVMTNYWRTLAGAEVDFIIRWGDKTIPVEIKYQRLKKPELTRSLGSFIKKYRPKTAAVVNLTLKDEIRVNGTMVKFIPYWELLFSGDNLWE